MRFGAMAARAAVLMVLMCAMQASASRSIKAATCLDPNCATCDATGWCSKCKEGYYLTTNEEKDAYQCQVVAPKPLANQTTTLMDIDPRIQYLIDDGFCAEEALQIAALYHGVWLPQLWTRRAANQSLLTGPTLEFALDNWDMMMERLHIDEVPFNGSGAQEYLAFAKEWLLQDTPVVIVSYVPGEKDIYWDHSETLVGVTTASKDGGYDPQDVFHLNTVVDVEPRHVLRQASEFFGTRAACKVPLEAGGCIPDNVPNRAGWAIRGTRYAGIGPHVQLKTKESEEPTVEGEDTPAKGAEWKGTAVLTGLQPGKAYTLYKFTDPDLVPTAADDKVDPAAAAWSATITAKAEKEEVPVAWFSGTPAWFVAVEA